MRNYSIRLAISAVACAWATMAHAQVTLPGTTIVPGDADRTTRAGTRGANFLHIGIGARAQGMAGASVASVEGPSAVFWNPANIATRERLSAFVSYERMYGNSGISNIGAALSLPVGQGAVALGVQQFSSGDIDRTTERAPDGNDPVFPGTYTFNGLAVSAHYARNVTDRLTAAIGTRFAREGIDFAHNNYFGADVSTRFNTGLYGLTVAASIMNIGNSSGYTGPAVGQAIREPRYNGNATGRDIDITYRTRKAQMPTSFNFGLLSHLYGDAESLFGASPNHSFTFEAAFKDAIDTDLQTALGVEYGYKKMLFARAGKRFFNEQHGPWGFEDGAAFGGGIRLPLAGRSLRFDYSYTVMGQLRNNQVLSFDIGS